MTFFQPVFNCSQVSGEDRRRALFNAQKAACYELVLYLHNMCPDEKNGWTENGWIKLYNQLLKYTNKETECINDPLNTFLEKDSRVTIKQRVKCYYLYDKMRSKKSLFETVIGPDYRGRYIIPEDRYEFE